MFEKFKVLQRIMSGNLHPAEELEIDDQHDIVVRRDGEEIFRQPYAGERFPYTPRYQRCANNS